MTDSPLLVEPSALYRRAVIVDEQRSELVRARDELRTAFDRHRLALGNDQYGAELMKELPAVEDGIFGGLQAYIDGVDAVVTGLRVSAARYEQAEQASTTGT